MTTAPTVNPTWRAIGARIQERRRKLDCSQRELAENMLGIRPQRLSDWEQGLRQPTAADFGALAYALGCSVADLLPGGES